MRSQSIARLGVGITAPAAARILRDSLKIPEFWPVVEQTAVGPDGRVFLGRLITTGDLMAWTVLKPNGFLEGTFRTPAALEILAVNGTDVWGTVTDELDVPYVIRFSLQAR